MDINVFIEDFAGQFEDTDTSTFTAETCFRELDEWDSLTALVVLNMVEKRYSRKLTFPEMRNANTIQELFDIVASKN